MAQSTKSSKNSSTKVDREFKDDALAPKGRTQHNVEPHWPTKDSPSIKKRKIKKTQIARLP